MNEGFGKDFHRKGNSVKRFGPFTLNCRTLKIEKLLSSSPSQKSALTPILAFSFSLFFFFRFAISLAFLCVLRFSLPFRAFSHLFQEL